MHDAIIIILLESSDLVSNHKVKQKREASDKRALHSVDSDASELQMKKKGAHIDIVPFNFRDSNAQTYRTKWY